MREVHEVIAKRKPAQYTTVLKTLQIMAEKGLARRNEKQRAHVYEVACPREWTQRQLARDLLQRALSSRKASRAEIAELRKPLDEHEKGIR